MCSLLVLLHGYFFKAKNEILLRLPTIVEYRIYGPMGGEVKNPECMILSNPVHMTLVNGKKPIYWI